MSVSDVSAQGPSRGHAAFPGRPVCGFEGAGLVISDLIARYGPEAELDELPARRRCSDCGRKGVPRVTPSWTE